MKNHELIKMILPLADKLDMLEHGRNCAYKGYELACILSNNYNGRVSVINSLIYSRWLYWAEGLIEQLEIYNKYL